MRFSLGINYWPRRSAMHMWQRFDPGEIADDFARIADLGLDAVRFFLRWADFQPEPRRMDHVMLGRLEQVMELLATSGLRAMPTLFCGHMSGVNWLPSWALDANVPSTRFRTIDESGFVVPHGCGDLYTGKLLEAQRLHAREVGAVLRGHPGVVAWDLGNEFSNVREPAAVEDAREWSKRLTDDLERASGHRVTGGIHGEDITRDRKIRPSSIAEPWAFATMHGYSVYSDSRAAEPIRTSCPSSAATALLSASPCCSPKWATTCPPGKISPLTACRSRRPAAPEIPSDDPVRAPTCLDETEMATMPGVLRGCTAMGGWAAGGGWADYDEYCVQRRPSTPPRTS